MLSGAERSRSISLGELTFSLAMNRQRCFDSAALSMTGVLLYPQSYGSAQRGQRLAGHG
jgi:hypothetical protein